MSLLSSDIGALVQRIEYRAQRSFTSEHLSVAAGGALARSFVAEASRRLPLAEGVAWIGFIFRGARPGVAYVTDLIAEGATAVALPDVVVERFEEHCGIEHPDGAILPQTVDAASVRAGVKWELSDNVELFLADTVRFSTGLAFPGNSGFVVAAVTRPSPELMVELQDCLARAVACVRDRIAFAISQDFADVRILATVDEEFQEGLILARKSSGLQEFLAALDANVSEGVTQSLSPSVRTDTLREPAASKLGPSTFNDARLRDAFEAAIAHLAPVGSTKSIHQVQLASGPGLSTPLGRWIGWAEFRYGLANMRYGQAVLARIDDQLGIHRNLAKFLSAGGLQQGNIGLVLAAPSEIIDDVREVARTWEGSINIAVCGL
jgi:hypothetical protein